MLNEKELIIGHFEGTLSSTEATHLESLLETSPEVRAAYEQQRAIEEGMVEDSESLVPPIGLREATIAAALGGALTTTVGGGIAAWLGSKAAALVGTVVVGGLVLGGIVILNDEEPTDAVVPTTQMEQIQTGEPVEASGNDASAQAAEGGQIEIADDVPTTSSPAPEGDRRQPVSVNRGTQRSSTSAAGSGERNGATDTPVDPEQDGIIIGGDQDPAYVDTNDRTDPRIPD